MISDYPESFMISEIIREKIMMFTNQEIPHSVAVYLEQMEEKKNEQTINIALPAEVADGISSNLAMITHSPSEFIVDFIRMMPGLPKAKVQSRIILTPQHAKRLLRALTDNIERYESVHGRIKDDDGTTIPYNNMSPLAEA